MSKLTTKLSTLLNHSVVSKATGKVALIVNVDEKHIYVNFVTNDLFGSVPVKLKKVTTLLDIDDYTMSVLQELKCV